MRKSIPPAAWVINSVCILPVACLTILSISGCFGIQANPYLAVPVLMLCWPIVISCLGLPYKALPLELLSRFCPQRDDLQALQDNPTAEEG